MMGRVGANKSSCSKLDGGDGCGALCLDFVWAMMG
jgi:hypothetical protein